MTPYVPWPADHGGRQRTLQLLQGLVEAGHDVTAACITRSDDDRRALAGLAGQLKVKPVAIPLPPVRPWSSTDRLRKWGRLLTGQSSLLARWISPDAVAALQAVMTPNSTIVADFIWTAPLIHACGRTVDVLSTHNIESDVIAAVARQASGTGAFGARREASMLAAFEHRVLREARAAIACSSDDAESLKRLCPTTPVTLVPNGINLAHLTQLPPSTSTSALLFVGSFDYPPNARAAHHLVKDWLPRLHARLPDLTVTLAGRDPEGALVGLARPPVVTVTGRVENVRPYYESAFAAVIPLSEGGGSRIKILEAFALGRPVITTRAGAMGLNVVDGEHLRFAESPEDSAAILAVWRSTPQPMLTIIRQARAWVTRHHDWARLRPGFAEAITRKGPSA